MKKVHHEGGAERQNQMRQEKKRAGREETSHSSTKILNASRRTGDPDESLSGG
jgi:hypothetical protein